MLPTFLVRRERACLHLSALCVCQEIPYARIHPPLGTKRKRDTPNNGL